MASDFDLSGRVRIDTSEVESLGGRLSSSLGGIGAAIAGAFAVNKIVEFGRGAIGVAADFQQTSIAFKTMLGSGEKAGAFLSNLRDFAAKTPFEFPELSKAASSLVSVGISADKVIPIMTSLGNATAGMGTGQEGIKRATIALQQMNAAGRITGEDLNQLRDAGVPVFELLTAATGKSTEEIAKMAQSGKLGRKELEQLMSALESGKGLERFNGLMDAQSKTLNGVISTFKDTLGNIAIDFITPYLPGMAAALQKLAGFIQVSVVPALREFVALMEGGIKAAVAAFKDGGTEITSSGFAGAMERIGLLARSIFDAFNGNGGGFQGFIDNLKAGGDAAGGGLSKGLADIAQGAKDFLDNLPSLNDTISVAGTVMKFLADNADTLGKVLPYVIAGFALYKAAQAAANTAALLTIPVMIAQVAANFSLAAAIRSAGSAASTSATQQVVAAGVAQQSALATAASAVANAARVVASWVLMGAQAALSAATTAGAWALSAGASMAGAIASTAVAVASVVAGWVVMGVQAMAGAIRMAAAWLIALGPIGLVIAAVIGVVALIIANWDTISRVTGELWEKVKAFTGSAWERLKETVAQGFEFVKNLFLNFTGPGLIIKHWDTIKRVTSEAWDRIKTFVSEGFSKIVDAVSTGAERVITFHRELPGRVLAALGNLGSMLLNAGKDLIGGLANGIENAAGKVIETIKRTVTDKLPQFVKDALGIHSRSKVFAALGKQIPAGLAYGILAGAGFVTDAMSNVLPTPSDFALPFSATSLNSAVSPSFAGVGAGGSSATIGDINLYGVTDGDSVRGVIPELVDAIVSGVGKR